VTEAGLGEGADKVAQGVVDAARQAQGEALVKMKAICLSLVFLKGESFSLFSSQPRQILLSASTSSPPASGSMATTNSLA
jgi:hypothetical protein